MDGLIIRQPFAKLVIEGCKDWEIRSKKPPKNKLGKEIYLLSEGSVLGKIKIVSFHGPLSIEELESTVAHRLSPSRHSSSAFAWTIMVNQRFFRPVRYLHPRGARVWVLGVQLQEDFKSHERRV